MPHNSAHLFETIYIQSPISTQIFSPDGNSLNANKAWEELWGAKHDKNFKYNILQDQQLVDSGSMVFVKRGFAGETLEIPAIKYEPAKTVKIEGMVPYRWVKGIIYPVKDSDGSIIKVIIQHVDITEQKAAEEKIFQSEERLRLALEAGKIGVWDWDIVNNSLTWSERVYEIHGVTKEHFELTFENFASLIHPNYKEYVNQEITKALTEKTPFNVTFKIVTPDKEVRWIYTRGMVMYSQDDTPVRMLGATTDITKQKKLEQQKDEFLGVASHELKTPVTSLKAYTQVLKHRFEKKGDSDSALQLAKMDSQLNKLTDLISDLLDITKIESGKLQLHLKPFNVNELVSNLIDQMQLTTDRHKIMLTGKYKRQVYGDEERLGQVITNFLSNAIKYSPHSKDIIVTVEDLDDMVKVSVTDFGVGISLAGQERVFERFYRVSGPKNETFPGLGLGLYISSEIIKRLGGTIGVTSKKGKGSTFYFSVPAKKRDVSNVSRLLLMRQP